MWPRFLRPFLVVFVGGLLGCLLLVLIVDPLGVSPIGIVPKPGLVSIDRRFLAPGLIGGGAFDSFLVGTSTIHSVDPAWAEAEFGGNFANLATHGATPYEMSRVVELIGERVPHLKRLIFGLDGLWCHERAPERYHPTAVFPEWLYDESRANDFTTLLNAKIVDLAWRQLLTSLGLKEAFYPPNGYRNQLVEAKWDAAKAKAKIATSRSDEATAGKSFPALALLEPALGKLPPGSELIVVLMPSHVTLLPKSSKAQKGYETCKQRIAAMVARRGGRVVDFSIPSAWTKADENYWDAMHFRVGMAHEFMVRLKEAVDRQKDAEDGVYRYLNGANAPTATTLPPDATGPSLSGGLYR